MANDKILHVSGENFQDQVLQSETPVMVDFWAEWCGPCRMVAPVLEELADEFDGKVRIAKLNIDDNQALAAEYAVQSIPTFVLFKNGQVADRAMGAMPKAGFERFLSANLGAA